MTLNKRRISMHTGSLITMIVILTIAWGGLLYFMNIAVKKEKEG